MHYLDHTWPTPAENLAADEALLDAAEAGEIGETIRFWQAGSPFVVLGHSNSLERETSADGCAALNIPILRRCSGGGAVLQGPGMLSYALVLRIDQRPGCENVTTANHHIMATNANALSNLLKRVVRIRGVTDLVLEGRKISGNAQRRRRRFLLFHGTLLVEPDLKLIERLLPLPSRAPDYRANRSHTDFLGSIPASPAALKITWRNAWGATSEEPALDPSRVTHLVATKYAVAAWNRKF